MIVVDEDIDQPINSAEIGVGGNSAKAYKVIWAQGLPRRGYRTQPRVSTLGTLKINGSP